METVTICSLDDEVYTVTHMDFDPATQDLFAYLEDLRKAMRRLDDLNERLPHNARVTFPPSHLRSRLVRAARQLPGDKTVVDSLIIQPAKFPC